MLTALEIERGLTDLRRLADAQQAHALLMAYAIKDDERLLDKALALLGGP